MWHMTKLQKCSSHIFHAMHIFWLVSDNLSVNLLNPIAVSSILQALVSPKSGKGPREGFSPVPDGDSLSFFLVKPSRGVGRDCRIWPNDFQAERAGIGGGDLKAIRAPCGWLAGESADHRSADGLSRGDVWRPHLSRLS